MNGHFFLLTITFLSLSLPSYSQEYFGEYYSTESPVYCYDFFDTDCFCQRPACSFPIEVSATYLLLQPNVEDTHYVLSSFDNTFGGSLFPKGERHQNEPSFQSGFALEAFSELCPRHILGTDFTFFNARFKSSVSGGFLYDTNGFPGFGAQDSPIYSGTAQSRNNYQFYAGDLIYKYLFDSCSSNHFAFVAGVQLAYIQFNENTDSFGTFPTDTTPTPYNNHLERDSKFFGLGPELGLDYAYNFPCVHFLPGELGLNFKVRGSLLCGYTNSNLHFITLRTGPGGVGVFNGDVWRVVPCASTDIGLDYALCVSGFEANVELGYLFAWYSRCVNKITGFDTAFTGDTIDVFNDFSLQGPYLRVSVAF